MWAVRLPSYSKTMVRLISRLHSPSPRLEPLTRTSRSQGTAPTRSVPYVGPANLPNSFPRENSIAVRALYGDGFFARGPSQREGEPNYLIVVVKVDHRQDIEAIEIGDCRDLAR